MSFFAIAGTNYDVTQISERERVTTGKEKRNFNNKLRTSVRAGKKAYDVTLVTMSQMDYNTLRGVVGDGNIVAVSGDFVDGRSIQMRVKITSAGFRKQDTDFLRDVVLSVEEA